LPHDLEHLLAFLASGVLFSIAYPLSRFTLMLVVGVGFAAGLEILQVWIPGRHARWIDFLMNASGICLGLAITSMISATFVNFARTNERREPMDLDTKEIAGACHCGTVRFRARLSNGFRTARRCTCSYCRMRGAVAVSAPVGGIEILAGAD